MGNLAKYKATMKYEKKAIRQFLFKFHKVNDAEVIAKLEQQESKNNYVRQLILADIAREKAEKEKEKL